MKHKLFFVRTAAAVLMVLMLLAALPVPLALAATFGPNNPGTGADVSGTGTVAWATPGNITTPGTPYATATLASGTSSHYLQATNYGFNIPYGSTITNIVLIINRQSNGTSNPSILDTVVSLVKNGIITGENKAQTTTDWPRGSFGTATYGNTGDPLWGTTWTAAEINAANFGVVLAVRDGHPSQARIATVDYMQITVTYTPPNNTTTVDCGSGIPVVTYGSTITCVATVTRSAGTFNPTGTVAWSSNGAGTIETSPCTLSVISAGVSSCSVTYTPTTVGTGTHSLTAIYNGDANFSGSLGTQNVTVNKKTASVAADAKSKTYGDDNPALTATVTGEVAGGDVISYTLSTTAVKLSNAGGYPITVTLGANPNYTVTPTDSTLTVNAKDASVVADAKSKTYGDDNPPLTAVVTGEVSGGAVISYTLDTSATKLSDAGSYPITVTLGANPNYTVTPTGSTLTVEAKDATVVADPQTKTYGDDNPPFTAVVTGEVVGGAVISYTLDTSATKFSDVGSYPITVTLGANPNYTVTPTGSTLTVDAKDASVVADPQTKTYGDDNPALTAVVTGEVVGGDVISYTLATTATKFSNVGSYPITVALGANPNYTVTPTGSTLTVDAKDASVVADPQTKTYGDDNPPLTAVVTGEVVGGDVISYTLATTALKLSDVGDYPINVNLGVNPNYFITVTHNTLTVNAKDATVVADPQTKTYGDDNPPLTATLTGEVSGGAVISYTLDTSATKFSDVGSYPITVTLGTNPNYTVTPTGSILAVSAKPATVAADPKSKFYGSDNPALTATVVGEVAGGEVISYTLATSASKFSPVGSYPITVTLGLNSNYLITPADSTLTVNPIPVTVTADPKSKLYGQPDPPLTYQLTSGALLNGDDFSGDLAREPGESVGVYAILQGTLALPGYYDLTYVGANFTIQVASPALTLVKTAAPQTYLQAGDVIQYTYVLTNTGNVPLDGPFTVADDLATDEACPPDNSLAVGAPLTCTASYTITPADVVAGHVTNTATASGAYAGEPVTSNSAQATVRTYRLVLPLLWK
jgi:hypothetical protein